MISISTNAAYYGIFNVFFAGLVSPLQAAAQLRWNNKKCSLLMDVARLGYRVLEVYVNSAGI